MKQNKKTKGSNRQVEVIIKYSDNQITPVNEIILKTTISKEQVKEFVDEVTSVVKQAKYWI